MVSTSSRKTPLYVMNFEQILQEETFLPNVALAQSGRQGPRLGVFGRKQGIASMTPRGERRAKSMPLICQAAQDGPHRAQSVSPFLATRTSQGLPSA